jgi:hypothetical protein
MDCLDRAPAKAGSLVLCNVIGAFRKAKFHFRAGCNAISPGFARLPHPMKIVQKAKIG